MCMCSNDSYLSGQLRMHAIQKTVQNYAPEMQINT